MEILLDPKNLIQGPVFFAIVRSVNDSKIFSLRTYLACLMVILAANGCGSSSEEGVLSSDQLQPTIYYKPVIMQSKDTCSSREKVPFLSPQGSVLATACSNHHKLCLLQGSCLLQLDKGWISLNYHSKKDEQYRFFIVDRSKCPFGFGAKNICLDPYFSIAADLDYFNLGDVLFIPDLVGLKLPTGESHDGFVVVRDKGGSIKGPERVDFFIGYSVPDSKTEIFTSQGFGDVNRKLNYRRATSDESEMVLKARAYPKLKPELRQIPSSIE